jgi:energy-coupling factor transporter ATP-binding protein EcfA2
MDSVSALATAAVSFLSPYLVKAGEKTAEKIGEKLPEAAGMMWKAILGKFKGHPAAEVAVQDLVTQPEDEDNLAAFRKELRKILRNDPAFAAELKGLLNQTQGQGSDTISNTGSGAVATRGGIAGGEGGLVLQGDVHGYINQGGYQGKEWYAIAETDIAQNEELWQAIADLEAKQLVLGIDFTQQIAQLRQRLDKTASMSQIGSEVTAATGGVAAGKRGVAVGGDVIGNIYVGPPARDPAEALMIYRQVLVEDCRHMSLRGLDISASDPTGAQRRFELAQVYVNLLTKTQVTPERESQPLSVLEAVAGHRHVVLLGDPGSGKSTFLSHLALCLAKHGLEPQQNWLERLPSWPEQDSNMVPILVTLRDFVRWLPDPLGIAEPHHLWDFIISRLEAQNLASAAKDFMLHDRLEHGQAVILLDGLDEIVVQRHRTFIRDVVDVFARRYPKCRVIVTCRTLSYQDPAWQLEDFNSFTLAPFNGEQIDQFITAWYGELARLGSIPRGSIEGVTRGLRGAVRRPDLWRLASNPLLLTVMAVVHTHRGRLPQARALLYEESVDILLWLWEQVKVSGEDDGHRLQQLLEQAHRTDVDLKRSLWRLAFEMHQESGTGDTETVADIGELRLHKTLMELHPDKSWDWAHEVVEVMKLRAGLLVERIPEVYAFPHRTFQEYLAGAHLSSEPDFAQQAARLAKEGAYWRDVILLGVGRLVYLTGDTAKPLALVAELCPAALADTDIAWRQVWLAGEVLLEIGLNRVNDSALGRELGERVRRGLVSLLSNGSLTPVEQASAGDTLAAIGDPRFHVDRWYLPDEPMLGFVEIPDGPFRIGSDQKRDSQAFGREAPDLLAAVLYSSLPSDRGPIPGLSRGHWQ